MPAGGGVWEKATSVGWLGGAGLGIHKRLGERRHQLRISCGAQDETGGLSLGEQRERRRSVGNLCGFLEGINFSLFKLIISIIL